MEQINENYPEDLNDLIINELELEYPIGFNYSDDDLDEKFIKLKEKLNIKEIYISSEQYYEDTQFAESKYFHEIEVTYKNEEKENYLVICEVYGDPSYELISENENEEIYNEYINLAIDYSENEENY